MMYVSVYPVAISIRNTNVYEEKSLGLFAPEEDEHVSFVGMALKRIPKTETPQNKIKYPQKQIETEQNKTKQTIKRDRKRWVVFPLSSKFFDRGSLAPAVLVFWILRLATHIRDQLGYDLWYVFLGLFLICIIESSQIQNTNDYVSPRPMNPPLHILFFVSWNSYSVELAVSVVSSFTDGS